MGWAQPEKPSRRKAGKPVQTVEVTEGAFILLTLQHSCCATSGTPAKIYDIVLIASSICTCAGCVYREFFF